jgi:hypothetical protein
MVSKNKFKNTKELVDAYESGFVGAECDPEETKNLLAQLQSPLFGAAAYELDSSGEGKLSLPFKSLLKFDEDFGPAERQTTGDCVSHATRNAIDVTRAVEIHIKGQSERFEARGATEGIYQSRSHMGQGMTCSGAAKYVNQHGGILIRKNYGLVDLSEYNSALGARKKIPNEIYKTEARKHQVKTISLVSTVEEARDALANGYALSCCSMVGFSSSRDKNGISARKGSWAHAMAWIACDDTREIYDETLFLIQNSWGKWNGGPKRHGQPDGSFWVREKDARAILNARGSFVFSDVNGFPAKQLPDYGLGDWS